MGNRSWASTNLRARGHFQPFCSTKRRKCPHGFESNVAQMGSKWSKWSKYGNQHGSRTKKSQNRVKIGRKWVKIGRKWVKMGQNRVKAGPSFDHFWPFGAILDPFWTPKRPREPQNAWGGQDKMDQKGSTGHTNVF